VRRLERPEACDVGLDVGHVRAGALGHAPEQEGRRPMASSD
jgi:hypothetical protein